MDVCRTCVDSKMGYQIFCGLVSEQETVEDWSDVEALKKFHPMNSVI